METVIRWTAGTTVDEMMEKLVRTMRENPKRGEVCLNFDGPCGSCDECRESKGCTFPQASRTKLTDEAELAIACLVASLNLED